MAGGENLVVYQLQLRLCFAEQNDGCAVYGKAVGGGAAYTIASAGYEDHAFRQEVGAR